MATRKPWLPVRKPRKVFGQIASSDDGAGLGAVAALQLPCWIDPLPFAPDYLSLINPNANVQVDRYGLLGFPEFREWIAPWPQNNWIVCPNFDFCSGPNVESIPLPVPYKPRWMAGYYAGGSIFYGRTGGIMIPASVLLFPFSPNLGPTDNVSLSFDPNAICSFAIQSAPNVQIRRFVGGIPTVYTFAGTWPRLWYDGILQPDQFNVDLTCFYVNGAGQIAVRMERDNFAVEYVMITPAIPAWRLCHVDNDQVNCRQTVYFIDAFGRLQMARSAVYPAWPVNISDAFGYGGTAIAGDYPLVSVNAGTYPEDVGYGGTAIDGLYYSIPVVLTGPYPDDFGYGGTAIDGDYHLIAVPGGTYSDDFGYGGTAIAGDYPLVAVNGGTYSDDFGYGGTAIAGTNVATFFNTLVAALAAQGTPVADPAAFFVWYAYAEAAIGNPAISASYLVLKQPNTTTIIELDVSAGIAGQKIEIWWGDGTSDEYTTSGTASHTYFVAGVYGIVVLGNVVSFFSFFYDGRSDFGGDISTAIAISQIGATGNNTLSGSVTGLTALTYLDAGGSNTLSGSITGLTSLTGLTAFGNNTLAGSVAGLTAMTNIFIAGNNTISGSIAGLSALKIVYVGGNNTVSGFDSLAGAATGLCYLETGVTSVPLSASVINAILAGFVTNKDAAKTLIDRSIILNQINNSAPTDQGIIDKAFLQAYSSPTPPGTAPFWTVLTN